MDKREQKRTVKWGLPFLAAVVLLAGVAYFVTVDAPGETPITNIVDNTENYLGRTVSVRGEVDDTVASQALVLDEEGSVVGDEILVISRQPLEPVGGGSDDLLFDEGQNIHVAGQVRTFHREEIQNEVGFILDEETYEEWEGKPVIVATTVNHAE